MAWLDRDRTPARFTIATSVMSGLILTVIVKAVQTGAPQGALLAWFIVTSGAVAVASWAMISTIRRVRRRSRRAFLMTSAFSQKYYVAAFVQQLHSVFDRDDIDLVLKVPDRDYDASAQSHHLDRILERKHDYIGGIIVASEVHRLRDDLTRFCRESRLPVVFTDLEPFGKESDYPGNSAFIGYDTGQLGELAGKWLAQRLRGRRRARVLIIASREHSTRQERCAEVLQREVTDVLITTNDECGFVRARANDAVRSYIRQLDSRHSLDAIFCTNDEMALGAVDALSESSPKTRRTLVVGVDGVLEARTLIDTGCSPLCATVVQDTHRLAVGVVDLLIKMHRGRAVPKRTILNAEMYEANDAQALKS